MWPKTILIVFVVTMLGVLPAANGIKCYQCASIDHENPFQCNEFMPEDSMLEPTSCDHIDNAQYCLKYVGRPQGAIRCYQCDSSYNLNCTDMLIHDRQLQPEECSYLNGAAFCIKATGRFAGTLGTLRMCSTHDMGDQCMDVQQPGDMLRYRSCVYTCNTDGCNAASGLTSTKYLIMAAAAILLPLLL